MLTCPNCGYKQAAGDKCQKCSSLFAYYLQTELQGEATLKSAPAPMRSQSAASQKSVAPTSTAVPDAKPVSLWRTAYQILRWGTLAALIITIALILHKAAPPQVQVSPQAAASADAKFSKAEQAVASHEPYELTLDRTELNSYLNSNLQLSGSAPSPAASPDPPAASQSALARGSDPRSAPPENPSIAEVQSSVRDVTVDLEGDLVKAYVVFDFHGKDLSLELDGRLSSADGYLQFEPVAGWLGSFALPQSALHSAVEKLMSSPENREKLRLPAGVNGIKVEDGQLIIDYQ